MTSETLQIVVNAICLEKGEDLNGFELEVVQLVEGSHEVYIVHNKIENIELPSSYIIDTHNSRTKAKTILELINQIISNGDDWLEQEKNYWQDRKENEEENNWESKRDYKD